jgi:hypothetical protein
MAERHLGCFEVIEEAAGELERRAIIGCPAGRWYLALAIVDGDGDIHELIGLRQLASAWDAYGAYADLV